ncbi:MAG: hypothetical protein ACRDYA_10440 [Egibacteraceae bacterium]
MNISANLAVQPLSQGTPSHPSLRLTHCEPHLPGGATELSVTGDHHRIPVLDPLCGCEMDCVVTTQGLFLRQETSTTDQIVIDLNSVELVVNSVELGHRFPKRWAGQSSQTVSLRKTSASLGVRSPHRDDASGFVS